MSRRPKSRHSLVQSPRCRPLYYVSESDVLKALRYALFQEVRRTGYPLHGANLTALHNFVSVLAQNFPTTTRAQNESLEVS